jgi:hypothetical protein
VKRLKTWTRPWDETAKAVERSLGRPWEWSTFGPDGIIGQAPAGRSVIATVASHDGVEWIHTSVARTDRLPSYHDLTGLHAAVWGDGYAYQMFVPASRHVNIHGFALHLWGRADGRNVLPDFGAEGTI